MRSDFIARCCTQLHEPAKSKKCETIAEQHLAGSRKNKHHVAKQTGTKTDTRMLTAFVLSAPADCHRNCCQIKM